MPKPTVFVVSAAKYLLKEKRFLLTAVGVFAVFTLFTAPLFSMITFTQGFIQIVDSDPYYLLRQASASEAGEEVTQEEEPTGEIVEEPPPPTTEPPPPPPPDECPPGTHRSPGTVGACIPDEPPPPADTTGGGVPESPTPPPSSPEVGTEQPPSNQQQPPSSPSSPPPLAAPEPTPMPPEGCTPPLVWNGADCVPPEDTNCYPPEDFVVDENGQCKRIPPLDRGELDGSKSFDIVVFGDSVMWGQGIREQDKFYSLVVNEIGAYIKEKTGKDIPVRILDIEAHSGAVIGFNWRDRSQAALHGEFPTSYPTIIKQVENYKNYDASSPWKIDLILVDGCMNDVNFRTILNKKVEHSELKNVIWTHCYYHMLQLLNTIKTKFAYNPEIKIIVTGYYKVFSQYTDMSRIPGTIKEEFGIQDSDKSWLNDRWQVIRDESTRALELAVIEANLDLDQDQIFFAIPDFRDENAIFAPNSFLWGAIERSTLGIYYPYPVDDVINDRIRACDEHYSTLDVKKRIGCYMASLAHPDRGGALAYANAIKLRLPDIGLPLWVTQGVGPPAPAPTPLPPPPTPPLPPPTIENVPEGGEEGGQSTTTEERQRCILTTAGLLCPTTRASTTAFHYASILTGQIIKNTE
jgi:hypothetical protein